MSLLGAKPSDESWHLWLKFILSIGLYVWLLYCLPFIYRHFIIHCSSRNWPKTIMTITNTQYSDRGVEFTYEFEVEGQTFSDNNISKEICLTSTQVQDLINKYAVGSTHDVYYQPDDPGAYSVLAPGGNWVLRLVACILAVLSVIGLFWNIREHYDAIFLRQFDPEE